MYSVTRIYGMNKISWKITTSPSELEEGLFGQIILWTLEILPYLEKHLIFPHWDIKSKLYGTEADNTVIPGLLDLAYPSPKPPHQNIRLLSLRQKHASILGGDWVYIHNLWHAYFKIPDRIMAEAEAVDLPPNTLGIHYRGNDKNSALWDTNPVNQDDFLILVKDFLKWHQNITSVFVATDEFSFVEHAKRQLFPLNVINLGEVNFHKSSQNSLKKGDRALLDCLLLSKCQYLIKCSSALSGFAQVLNPQLESYRISASKLFTDIPYFPDAYIPRLTSTDPVCTKILEEQFANDWLDHPYARFRFNHTFKTQVRYGALTKLKRWLSR